MNSTRILPKEEEIPVVKPRPEWMIGGTYLIQKFINHGTFSSVYLGQNWINKAKVAIKIQTQHPEMLLHEATILQHLHQKGCTDCIPSLYWFGEYRGHSCMIIQYYNVCLNEILFDSKQRIHSVKDLNELMVQMISCLQNIHSVGIIHRDVKPKNFMIQLPTHGIAGASANLHLIDFGMASHAATSEENDKNTREDDDETIQENFTGNLKYMSWFVENRKSQAGKRDDLISAGYIYILAAVYSLLLPVPEKTRVLFKNTDWKKRDHLEKLLAPAMASHECWRSIHAYLDYCYELAPGDTPKYYLLSKCFH